jgi:hypothetical protein
MITLSEKQTNERVPSVACLQTILRHRFPDQFTAFADLFAMGCLLHYQGERCAAHRLIGQVFDTIGQSADKTYFASLLLRLSGNEMRFACEIQPSREVRELCDRAVKAPPREIMCNR